MIYNIGHCLAYSFIKICAQSFRDVTLIWPHHIIEFATIRTLTKSTQPVHYVLIFALDTVLKSQNIKHLHLLKHLHDFVRSCRNKFPFNPALSRTNKRSQLSHK